MSYCPSVVGLARVPPWTTKSAAWQFTVAVQRISQGCETALTVSGFSQCGTMLLLAAAGCCWVLEAAGCSWLLLGAGCCWLGLVLGMGPPPAPPPRSPATRPLPPPSTPPPAHCHYTATPSLRRPAYPSDYPLLPLPAVRWPRPIRVFPLFICDPSRPAHKN